jgi:hypothetical protein
VLDSESSSFAHCFRNALETTSLFADEALGEATRREQAALLFARCRPLAAMLAMQERFVLKETTASGDDATDMCAWPSLTLRAQVTALLGGGVRVKRARKPVLRAFMHYIYLDELKCPPHMLPELGAMATRCMLPRLAELCRKSLLVYFRKSND